MHRARRVALGLAELLAGSISDDRASEHIDVHTAHLVNQVQAGGEVAPLVGAAEFQRAVVFVKQVEEVVALQHLIAELGEGDAFLGVQAASHGVFGQHGAQAEVLADIAQEVDDGHRSGPIVVGHETHRVGAFSLQNAADLVLEAVGPAGHHVLGLSVRSPDWRGSPIRPWRHRPGRLDDGLPTADDAC